jgi:hypothetical protein
MKALTIFQPWCTLIVAGAKPWEWRGWPAPKAIVGQRIVLHASVRPMRLGEIDDMLTRIDDGESSLDAAIALPIVARVRDAFHSLSRHTAARMLPLAAGLGTAILGKPISATDWAKEHAPGFDSDRLDHSKWAWPLTSIERWEPVRPARGMMGFWEWRE